MPTEPIAALLYVCLLLPGLVFVWMYEGHRSVVKRSAFRETANVVIASAVALGVVFIIHYALGFVFEPVRDSVREFFIDPGKLFRDDSQFFIAVVLLDLFLAVLVAAFLGSKRANDILRTVLRVDEDDLDRGQSGWVVAFERKPGHIVHVGVQLKSGVWLQGALDTFNRSGDDTLDRALTLNGPIGYRQAEAKEVQWFDGYGTLIVQASEIDYVAVGYEPSSETVR